MSGLPAAQVRSEVVTISKDLANALMQSVLTRLSHMTGYFRVLSVSW